MTEPTDRRTATRKMSAEMFTAYLDKTSETIEPLGKNFVAEQYLIAMRRVGWTSDDLSLAQGDGLTNFLATIGFTEELVENIKHARPDITDEEISSFAEKLLALVGEKGTDFANLLSRSTDPALVAEDEEMLSLMDARIKKPGRCPFSDTPLFKRAVSGVLDNYWQWQQHQNPQ